MIILILVFCAGGVFVQILHSTANHVHHKAARHSPAAIRRLHISDPTSTGGQDSPPGRAADLATSHYMARHAS